MITVIPTAAGGATLKPGPMVTVAPDREMTDGQLAAFAGDSGLNGPYLADLLSGFLAHERDGVVLFRALGAITKNPLLQSRYGQFREESERAVAAYESLVATLGGSPQYVSPPARLTMQTDAKMLEALLSAGSADELSVEMQGVQTVLAAAAVCLANAELVARLGQEADQGSSKTALLGAAGQLGEVARGHYDWARNTCQSMAVTQAKSRLAQKVGAVAEQVVGKAKDLLH